MEFGALVNLDAEDIAWEMIQQLTHEELLDFIVTLDGLVSDWSFTEDIYKWVKGEHKVYKAEVKEFS